MQDYLSRAGKTLLIIIIVVLSVAYVNERKKPVIKLVLVQIPSQREIQQRLTDLDDPRYDPNGVDGVIGKDSRTAWDNYECDKQAKKCFKEN